MTDTASQPAAEIEEDTSPAVAGQRPVESATLAIILAFSLLMAWDNWRTGVSWGSTGPKAGYFPFYVDLMKKITQTAEFKDYMEKQALKPVFLTGNDMLKFLEQDDALNKGLMTEAGFVAQ